MTKTEIQASRLRLELENAIATLNVKKIEIERQVRAKKNLLKRLEADPEEYIKQLKFLERIIIKQNSKPKKQPPP